MKYEFGVMSSKYELEAKNDNIAFITMVMFFGKANLPIAIYKPFQKTILGHTILDMDNVEEFIGNNRDNLKSAKESIKKNE